MIGSLVSLVGELVLVAWLAAAAFWAVASTALASWLGRPWWQGMVLGAVLLPLGPAVLLTIAAVAHSKRKTLGLPHPARSPATWKSPVQRWMVAAGAVLLAVALVWATGRPDTQLAFGQSRHLDLAVRDLGLTTVTLVSVVALAAAAAVSIWRPTRWAAVAVSWCGAWWLLWSLAALLVGDTLRVLVASAHVITAVPIAVRVGLSWSLLFAVAVLLVSWSTAVLFVTGRGVPALRGAPAAPQWAQQSFPALGATATRSLPARTPAELPAPRAVDAPVADPFADGWAAAPRTDEAPIQGVPGWPGPPTTQRAAQPVVDPFSAGW